MPTDGQKIVHGHHTPSYNRHSELSMSQILQKGYLNLIFDPEHCFKVIANLLPTGTYWVVLA